ncbi:MAG: phosphate ABC transporter permease PstA [Phycisphaerae bacterium]|nr:phosphate ABC transporter permease PstA [Phycisphaerae bacterium]
MIERSYRQRNLTDAGIKALSGLSALVAIFFLGWILIVVALKGASAVNVDFFTQLPTPIGEEGGGLRNAILGTIVLTVLATAIGVPLGVLGGVYLAEYGLESRFADAVRFVYNVLMGTPSIIVGVFVYTILVVEPLGLGTFSGYAGAVALAVIMLPVVARTTEDMLALVPNALRESALALGAPRWKVTVGVVFRAAKTGLVTGCLLAIARVSGETAPLLFTALNSSFEFSLAGLGEPTPNLTVTIWNYAMSPFEDLQRMAWGASLLITLGVLLIMLFARFLVRERKART